MAALRFTLFIALLLGVALLAAPHQVTAEATTKQCYSSVTMCFGNGLRCRECVTYCMQVAYQLKGYAAARANYYALRCGQVR